MANGLCHVEAGGGTWHVSAGLMPDKSLLSEVKPQQHQQPHPLSKLDPSKPGGAGVGVQSQGGGRTAGPESLSTLPDPQPVLPPSLRESVRIILWLILMIILNISSRLIMPEHVANNFF